MIIYKVIQTSIDIEDPISTFVNANTNLLNKLSVKYEGRCFSGCFILKVLTIVKRSECIIMQNNESGDGSIDIKFRAQVIELVPDEVLSNCTVIRKDTGKLLIATTDICALNVGTDGILDSIKVGQKIPVKIKKCLYAVGSSRIQAYAAPYVPTIDSTAYDFKGAKVTKEDMAILKDIKSLIDDEEELFEDLDENEVKFFSMITYPYKEKRPVPKIVKVIDLNNIKEGDALNIIGRPSDMDANKPSAYQWATEKDVPDEISIEEPENVGKGLHSLWINYYQRLLLIREFVDTYKSKSDKESHVNLWKIFKGSQK